VQRLFTDKTDTFSAEFGGQRPLSSEQIALQTVVSPAAPECVWWSQLVLNSGFAPEAEADCAVVEHDEAATKATRVLVGVNRG
jgi:hypothetical protein